MSWNALPSGVDLVTFFFLGLFSTSSNDLGLFDDKEELDLDDPDFEVPVLGFGKDMVFWANKLALKQHQSSAIINGIGVIRFILRSDFFFDTMVHYTPLTLFLHKWLQIKVQKYAIICKLCA